MSGEEEIIEVTIDMVELKKMKVPELKKKVAELGLPTKGTKAELLARVEKYLHEQEEEELLEEEEEEEEDGGQGEGEEVGGGQEANMDESKGDSILEQAEAQVQAEAEVPTKAEDSVKETAIEPAQPIKQATVSVSNLATSHAERLAQRAAKFGANSSEDAKKLARVERFGTVSDNGYKGLGKRAPPTGEELEKLKKRAERFGSSVSPAITAIEEDEKKKKRSERFGLTATELCVEDRKKLRAARFGSS